MLVGLLIRLLILWLLILWLLILWLWLRWLRILRRLLRIVLRGHFGSAHGIVFSVHRV